MKDVAAEEALLASAWLGDNRAMIEQLEERDFVDEFCGWLFRLLSDVVEAGQPLDMIFVMRRARKPEVLNRLPKGYREGMAGEIARVLTCGCTSAHTEHYFKVVRTERLNRAIVSLACAMRERVEAKQEPDAILEFVIMNAEKLAERLEPQP